MSASTSLARGGPLLPRCTNTTCPSRPSSRRRRACGDAVGELAAHLGVDVGVGAEAGLQRSGRAQHHRVADGGGRHGGRGRRLHGRRPGRSGSGGRGVVRRGRARGRAGCRRARVVRGSSAAAGDDRRRRRVGRAWLATTCSPSRRLAAMGSVDGRKAAIMAMPVRAAPTADHRSADGARRRPPPTGTAGSAGTATRRSGTTARRARTRRRRRWRARPTATSPRRCRAAVTAAMGQCHR